MTKLIIRLKGIVTRQFVKDFIRESLTILALLISVVLMSALFIALYHSVGLEMLIIHYRKHIAVVTLLWFGFLTAYNTVSMFSKKNNKDGK